MADDSSSKTERTGADEAVKERAEYTPSTQTDFLREKIKQKPVNKKKLLRRTIITASMAVVFGIVACLTFLILEPVINNWLYPEEPPEEFPELEIQFPEETVTQEEEMSPEDMLTEEMIEEETKPVELEDAQIEELLAQVKFGLDEYQAVYNDLAKLTKNISRSLVMVTGFTSDVDWFNNPYENEAKASGVIVANNGRAMLILVSMNNIKDAERILVTFCDNTRAEVDLVQRDKSTGLAVLSVPLTSIGKGTMDIIDIASLGSSSTGNLPGTPVIALGSPTGAHGSVGYGIITTDGVAIDKVDAVYKMISTDIYGSRNATGIIVNLKGKVIGIIDNSYNSRDRENLISAYGISELKKAITKLSNNQARAYLGIHGADVPQEANLESGMPLGTYVKEIEMDSPAMTAGIQSGDIIIKIGDTEIINYAGLLNVLYNTIPDDVISVTLMRQGIDGFQEMNVEVTLGEM